MSDLTDAGIEPATTKEDLTPSVAIVNGIYAYGPFILAGWIAFEIARRQYQRAYYCRNRSSESASPTLVMAKNSSFLGWIWPLYTTSDDIVLEACGLDTLFFLRFLRMCQKIAWMGIFCSVVLFPIYYYGVRGDKNDVMYKMTLSHLNPEFSAQSWRFWFCVLAMYVMSAWTCYLLYTEFLEYVRRRHVFLSRKTTQQYTVVINGLPKHLQTQQTLKNYLEVLFPGLVEHVYVAIECGDLEKLVAEREKVRNRMEHVLAQSAMNGERVFTRTKIWGGEKVDAIQLYEGQLKTLNEAVEMEIRAILRNQAALANQMLEGGVLENDMQVAGFENSDVDSVENAYIRGLRKDKGDMKNTKIMRDAGFVTFNKLRAAQVVQQVLQCADPTKVQVEAAPDVDDIVWENIGISYNLKQYWGLVSLAATVAIILFWTIPTSSVVALSKVDKLKTKWAGLKHFADKNPWISPVLEQISPLMLSVMNALAPIILGILSKREGHASAADIDNSLFNKLVAYQWFLVFLLPVLGTSFLDSLLGKGKKLNPSDVIDQLSNSVPVQSSFFISFLMVQMGLPTSLELLRAIPIAKGAIYRVFAPQLTPRERTSPWFGLTPVDIPGTVGVTDLIAQYFLVLILILVFAAVAPILSYFAAAYLFLSDLVYRWNVLCISDPSPNTGAVYFPALYRYCIAALLFAQVLMAALLGLKKAAAPATIALILPGFTVLFHLFVWSRYPHTALNLPLDECVLIDNLRHRNLEDLESVLTEDTYQQPAMAQRAPLVPDYANLESDPNDENQIVSPVEKIEAV